MDGEDGAETASALVWIALILIATVSFWAQAVTTEERFVPALNVVAVYYNMPDDVAGATLMAAGASSPELFSAIVSLFITHSSLGLGTVVGSEIFNQLCICSGAVMAARNYKLNLDKAIVIREMSFYGLAIILLLVALWDRRPDPDDPSGANHIFISFWDALILVGAYVLYVVVLANFDAILLWIGVNSGSETEKLIEKNDGPITYGSVQDSEGAPVRHQKFTYIRQLSHEPSENFHTGKSEKSLHQSSSIDENEEVDPDKAEHADGMVSSLLSLQEKIHQYSTRAVSSFSFYRVAKDAPSPTDVHGLEEIVDDEFEDSTSFFLWQRSRFYNRAKIAMHAWDLRWFTITHDSIKSVAGKRRKENRVRTHPRFDKMELDESHLILKLIHHEESFCILMAPTTKVFKSMKEKCSELMEYWETHEAENEEDIPEEDPEPRLIDAPFNASKFGLIVHFLLLPVKALMHFTIPDVRCDKKPSIGKAYLAVVSCLIWLIVASYYMVSSLESLAELLNVPDSVAGVTVSAAGTSLPNYVASQVAARQGLGNMAVSNAFGSNIFNIMVGLGVPWLLYTAFVLKFDEYHELIDDGIGVSVVILAVVLLSFVVLVFASNFVLYRWHAVAFAVIYATYVTGVIVSVYV